MGIKLNKGLGLLGVFSITSGAMMSSGLFILPGLAFAKAGPAVVVSYFLAGLLAIPGLLSQAELATAMPKSGGTYFYITRSLGPAIGTVYGLITWFAMSMKSAFALVGMIEFAKYFTDFNPVAIAIILCFIFVLVNILGVKESGGLQIAMVFCILTGLLIYVIWGMSEVHIANISPFAPRGAMSVVATAAFVFVSYGGLLKIASVAEEVKEPRRVLPLGMILSLVVVGLIYVLVVFVTTGVLEGVKLDGSLTPISDGANAFMGHWGRVALGIIAIIAFSSAANAGIMAASRYPMALGRDALMPEFLGRISERFKTPHVSIIATGVFIAFIIQLQLDMLVKVASSVIILTYIFTCLSVVILRESRLQNYQPSFQAPLYPWLQVVGIVGCGFLLYEIGSEALLISLIFFISGFLLYVIYGRVRTEQEYALMHLIERITAKELTTHSLEAELKEIIRERDEIVRDRFDRIIEKCIVLDIEEEMDVDEFFKMVSDKMARRLKMKPRSVLKMLNDREKESSTVLTPGMAIPHVVIKGTGSFDILVARCTGGVLFSEDIPRVHAVFVLIGTRDERNFHLRSLAAIAQIVQVQDFEEQWKQAKGSEVLRDIVLLGKRRR